MADDHGVCPSGLSRTYVAAPADWYAGAFGLSACKTDLAFVTQRAQNNRAFDQPFSAQHAAPTGVFAMGGNGVERRRYVRVVSNPSIRGKSPLRRFPLLVACAFFGRRLSFYPGGPSGARPGYERCRRTSPRGASR